MIFFQLRLVRYAGIIPVLGALSGHNAGLTPNSISSNFQSPTNFQSLNKIIRVSLKLWRASVISVIWCKGVQKTQTVLLF